MSYKLRTQEINGLVIQTGEGIPIHTSIPNAIYIDTLTNYEYIFTTKWFLKNQIQKVMEINMNSTQGVVYTILPQIPNTLYVPTSLILTTTQISGTPTTGLLTFSQGGGPGWSFTFSLSNQDTLKEVTYIFDESYGGRTAIDLQNIDWTVTLTQQSDATSHKITLITNGTLIPLVENTQVLFESGIVELTYIEDIANIEVAPILSNCLYFDGTNSSIFTFEEMISISDLEINYSFDGVTWLIYNLGDILVPNLYTVFGNDFILGDGFIGYVSKVTLTILTLYDTYEVIFLNSSGDETQELPILE